MGRRRDSTGSVVTIAMLVLAVLGVVTVFHQPLGALISPPSPAPTGEPANPR